MNLVSDSTLLSPDCRWGVDFAILTHSETLTLQLYDTDFYDGEIFLSGSEVVLIKTEDVGCTTLQGYLRCAHQGLRTVD